MASVPNPTTPSAEEIPLGIQRPLLPPVPLGQSMLLPKFLTPLGAHPLNVLNPSIFLPEQHSLDSEWQSPFQDPAFFDVPERSTTSNVDLDSGRENTTPPTAANIDTNTTQPSVQRRSTNNSTLEAHSPESLPEISRVIEPSIVKLTDPSTNSLSLLSNEPTVETQAELGSDTEEIISTIQPSPETNSSLERVAAEPGLTTPESSKAAIAPSSNNPGVAQTAAQPIEQSEQTVTNPLAEGTTQFFQTKLSNPELIEATTQPVVDSTPSTVAETTVHRKQEPTIAPIPPNPSPERSNLPSQVQTFAPESATTSTPFAFDEIHLASEPATIDALPDSVAESSSTEEAESPHVDPPISEIAAPFTSPYLEEPQSSNQIARSISPQSPNRTTPNSGSTSKTDFIEFLTKNSINLSSLESTEEPRSFTIQAKQESSEEELTSTDAPIDPPTPSAADSSELPTSQLNSDSSTAAKTTIDPSLQLSSQPPLSSTSLSSSQANVSAEYKNTFEQVTSQPVNHPENLPTTSLEEIDQPSLTSSKNSQESTQISNAEDLAKPDIQTAFLPNSNLVNNASTDHSSSILPQTYQENIQTSNADNSIKPEIQTSTIPGSNTVDQDFTDSRFETNFQAEDASYPLDEHLEVSPHHSENSVFESTSSHEKAIASTNLSPSPVSNHSQTPTIQARQDDSALPIQSQIFETAGNNTKNINLDESLQGNQAEANVINSSPTPVIQPKRITLPSINEPSQLDSDQPSESGNEQQDVNPGEQPLHETSEIISSAISSAPSTPDISTFPASDLVTSPPSTKQATTPSTEGLPELPTAIQPLSVWEPLVQLATIAPVVKPPLLQTAQTTRSTAIPENQWAESSDRTPANLSAAIAGNELKIQRLPNQPGSNRSTAGDDIAPVTNSASAEWSNIAELFAAATSDRSESPSPQVTPANGYADLNLHPVSNSSSIDVIQREPETSAATTVPENPPSPTEPTQAGQNPSSQQQQANASPEQLERLAQEIYCFVRQRLALERERVGQTYSGRLP